jgi:hypothetical protein
MVDHPPDRPIDRIRNSALSMKVGEAGDGRVCAMIDMQDSLFSIHEHAIYAVQLADQIDPQRENAALPNTHQKILSMGAQDPAVGRTYLTAYALFKSTHLGDEFEEKRALKLAFDFLSDVAAMVEMQRGLESATNKAIEELAALPARNRNLRLPALGDASHRCDAFTQKIGHAVDTLEEIARLFYPNEITNKWVDSLIALLARKHGDNAPVTRAMRERGPVILRLRNLRNMVEHPKQGDQITVHDFKLSPSMDLVVPSVVIERPEEETATCSLVSLMQQVCDALVDEAEHLFGLLAAANVRPFSKFNVCLIELPKDRRPKSNPHQRLSYGIEIHGRVQPFG